MKQTLAILLALVALATFGQEATVKSVAADPFDYSASKYKMTDLNGNTAALVIVRVLADNVEFKGNVLDGGVVHKTGEYWVYMGVGTKMLRIHSDKFLPVEIRFPDYGIPRLEAATTYAVTLTLPQGAAQPQSAAAGYNYLVLNVSPATAQVTIDGKPAAVQGGVAKRLLRSGASYSYRVEAQGYMPEEGTVAIGAERVDRNVALRSTKGKLSVATTTPGTEIYVNGDRMGAGSWSGELLPDNYLVEGRLAGHRGTDMMVSVATGETRTVTLPALAAITGSLNVDYTPAGASVAIDGTTRGTTPNVFDGLLTGSHTVTISAPGYQPATLTATIAENDLSSLEGALTKQPETNNNRIVKPIVSQNSHNTEMNYIAFKDSQNGKYGFKGDYGKIMIAPMYDYAWSFENGMARVLINGKYGFIDNNNKLVVPAIYDEAASFSDDLARVKINGKYGFVDKNNKLVIPAMYDDVYSFSEGLARVRINGKYGFIDKNNKLAIPAMYDSIERQFHEGLLCIKANGKWGFINKSNKFVIPAVYDWAFEFNRGKAKVKLNGREFYIDKTGKEVK